MIACTSLLAAAMSLSSYLLLVVGHFHALVSYVPPRVVSLGHVGLLGLELLRHPLRVSRSVLVEKSCKSVKNES